MTLLRWVENVGAMTLSLAVGAHNESCVLSLISALPANSHRSMETFANARWFHAAESAQEIRDPKSYPSCALAFLISHEIAKYLERLGSRLQSIAFAVRAQRRPARRLRESVRRRPRVGRHDRCSLRGTRRRCDDRRRGNPVSSARPGPLCARAARESRHCS